jgi:hypothetical protein
VSSLELRILAYGILALVFASGNIWIGYHFTAKHYEALAAKDQLARDQAVQLQQQQTIAQLTYQQAAIRAAENKYESLKTDYTALSSRFDNSLSKYTEVHSQLVSATSTAAALAHAAATGACSDPEVTRLSGDAVKATLNDAARLDALQTWASTSSTSH